jgi:HK97 family phage major capsid protein
MPRFDETTPSLRAQAERYFSEQPNHRLLLVMPDSTRAALKKHAPSTFAAWESGSDGFPAAAQLDMMRLSNPANRGESLSESGKEAFDALEVLLIAERHNAQHQRKLERQAGGIARAAENGWHDGSGRPVEVFAAGQSVQQDGERSPVSLGEFLGAVISGGKALERIRNDLGTTPDSAGGYTVPAPISREFIDRLRAKSALLSSGAQTVMMESKTQRLVRVTADPTVTWRASENASITPSDPTFGALDLSAKTVAALTKISFELAQDSANAYPATVAALTGAMALAIDKAGLHGATNGPSGLAALSGRTTVASVGAPNYDAFLTGLETLAAADVDIERCNQWIMSPRTWGDIARLKTGITNDNTPRPRPAALADHKFRVTSSVLNTLGAGSDSVIFGGDFRDVVFGVRQDITIRVLPERFADSMAIGVLVFARVDWGVLRPASIATLEGVTNV